MPRPGRKPNPSGVHFLAARHVVDGLLASCPVGPDDLVLDLGAGLGAVTAPLAETGATVVAVERDPDFVRRLRERLAGTDNVRVVPGDVRNCPLPRKDFAVVASIPYAVSTQLLRRLLQPQDTALRRAALVVEWGFARRVASSAPRSRELAWWAGRFEIELVRRVPAACFSPAPMVDSAQLAIRRRGLGRRAEAALWALLDAAYRAPRGPAHAAVTVACGHKGHGALRACGVSPGDPAGTVPARRWAELAAYLAADRSLHWPKPATGIGRNRRQRQRS